MDICSNDLPPPHAEHYDVPNVASDEKCEQYLFFFVHNQLFRVHAKTGRVEAFVAAFKIREIPLIAWQKQPGLDLRYLEANADEGVTPREATQWIAEHACFDFNLE